MSKLSYERLERKYRALQHRNRNLASRCRYWRHRQRELERMRRYRMRTKLVVEDGVKADIPEDAEIACDELNEYFDE